MNPNFFGMMQYPGMMDWKYLEMQAQYLRMLADMYADDTSTGRDHAAAVQTHAVYAQNDTLERRNGHGMPQEMQYLQGKTPPAVTEVSNQPVVEVARVPTPPLPPSKPLEQAPKAVLTFSPPRVSMKAPPIEVASKRKVIDFDEVPVGGAGRDFNSIMEQALQDDRQPPVRVTTPARTKEFLKKKPRPLSAARPRPTPMEIAEEPPQQSVSDTPKPPKEFLRRGTGQLCINPKLRKSESMEESFVSQKSVQSVPRPPSRQAPVASKPKINPENDLEMVKKLKKQVEELTKHKKELLQDIKGAKLEEDALNEEIEEMKREMEGVKSELEEKKREETAKIQKERKVMLRTQQSKQVDELEVLRTQVKEMSETAQLQEAAHKAALEELKNSIKKAKNAQLGKQVGGVKMQEKTVGGNGNKSGLAAPVFSKPQEKEVPPVIDTSAEEDEAMSPADSIHDVHGEDVALLSFPPDTSKLISSNSTPDGKVQKTYSSGRKEITFPDGIRKEIHSDGTTVVHFTNSDVKQTLPNGVMIYYFAETQTIQASYPDNIQKFKFPNGQIEKHLPDGTKEVSFPDGTVKCIYPDGEEESIFPDGTVQKRDVNGVKYIDFVSGQRDVIYPDGRKVRTMADGTVKTYPPGRDS